MTKKKKTENRTLRMKRHPITGRLAVYLGKSPSGVDWWVYPDDGETIERFAGRVKAQQAGLKALRASHAKLNGPTKRKARR